MSASLLVKQSHLDVGGHKMKNISAFRLSRKNPNEAVVDDGKGPVWVMIGDVSLRIHRAEDDEYTLVTAYKRNHEAEDPHSAATLYIPKGGFK
jgi:hypothetical protein